MRRWMVTTYVFLSTFAASYSEVCCGKCAWNHYKNK